MLPIYYMKAVFSELVSYFCERKITKKYQKSTKNIENSQKKYFNQFSGACSTPTLHTLIPQSSFDGKPKNWVNHSIVDVSVRRLDGIRILEIRNLARFQTLTCGPGFDSSASPVRSNQTKSLVTQNWFISRSEGYKGWTGDLRYFYKSITGL